MKMKPWILLLSCWAAFVIGPMAQADDPAASQTVQRQPNKQRPNIVLIMADDLGYECVGANGGTSYKTPNLDRLASGGMRFQHCHSQPLCTPSRVKLMTGLYNKRNYEKFGSLPSGQRTFSQVLQQAGYRTCVVGKWQLGGGLDGPGHFGFDEYCLWQVDRRPERYPNAGLEANGQRLDFTKGEFGPDVVSDFACQFIEANKQQPFLVYYPMILTHCPFCPTPGTADYDPQDKGSKTYKGDAKYFGDMVTHMDKIVGKIERQLIESGVRDNTLILFTGDNGTDKPVVSRMGDREVIGGKGKMDDTGTHVPLIANWPGQIQANQVSDRLVDFSDFFPTVCQVAGVSLAPSWHLDGQSFLGELTGQGGPGRDWIYVWYARNGGREGKEWARDQRFKLYGDGRFFDVKNDPTEQWPAVSTQSLSSQSAKVAHRKLSQVLKGHEDIRPQEVAAVGEKWKAAQEEKKKKQNQKKQNQKKQNQKKETGK